MDDIDDFHVVTLAGPIYRILEGYARQVHVTPSEYLDILVSDHIAEKGYKRASKGNHR